MSIIYVCLLLIAGVVVSGYLARLTKLPLPIVQIAVGAAIAAMGGISAELDPHVFFILFLPPLLFLDGWRISKEDVRHDKWNIMSLAFGLVFATVLGMGLLLNWAFPAMPLPVAFALAAIISPTDPIAVSAITSRVKVPKRMMHILEGESLLNDASGLVCMRFAVAAALTGGFSLLEAAQSFTWMVVAGIGIGVVMTLFVAMVKEFLIVRLGEDPGSQILLSLLVPFGAYLAAEYVHASGILAAVGAGVTMAFNEQRRTAMVTTRLQRTAFWDTIQFSLNGMIFILLGEQLPFIVEHLEKSASEAGHSDPWWLLAYAVAITLMLTLLRFLWVFLSMTYIALKNRVPGQKMEKPDLRLMWAMAFAGVRGAITLAGIMTLPLTLMDGTPFPARELAITMAVEVILCSMVLASVMLPLLLKGVKYPADNYHMELERKARRAAAVAAVAAIEAESHRLAASDALESSEVSVRVLERYRSALSGGSIAADQQEIEKLKREVQLERQLRLAGVRAERAKLFAMGRENQLPDDLVRSLVHELDLTEARLSST